MACEKNLELKLKVIYFISSGSFACYNPFLIVFFKARNLNYIQMGICFAVFPLVGVILQPLWGYMTDKYFNKKRTLIIVMACSAFSILLLTISKNFYTITASIILLGLFMTSISPILDALCLEVASGCSGIQFGKIRLMGSIGFALCVFFMGIAIKYTTPYAPFYTFSVMNICCIAIVCTLNYKNSSTTERMKPGHILRLFKDFRFNVFMISIFMINMAMNANSSYLGELIKQTGGDVSNLGLLWFIVAMSEVPTFYMANTILQRFRDIRLYMLCLILYGIRFLIDSACSSWYLVVIVQLMQSVTFALYVISSLHYLNRILRPEMLTSGITLYSAIGSGLGGFIGNITGGFIVETLGIRWLYITIALTCFASLGVSLLTDSRCSLMNRLILLQTYIKKIHSNQNNRIDRNI